MSELARVLLAELAGDPATLARLRELVAPPASKVERGPELLTVNAAAQMLGCSAKTVRRRIADRSLPAVVEHGRVMLRADELHAYIEGLERLGARPARRRPRRAPDFGFLREQS